jgi:predicted phosphodiesterase
MRYIGDVHGNRNQNMSKYIKLTTEVESSIQVGDFGAGFIPLPDLDVNHRFIRGNHDDPAICAASQNWIPDGTSQGEMFFVGGAYSVDRDDRIIGRDWWPDEEISWGRLDEIIDLFAKAKPKIMITHDCPRDVAIGFWHHLRSRTASALQAMFEIHQPELWIFGHHHTSVQQVVNGTKFICLAELEYIDLI